MTILALLVDDVIVQKFPLDKPKVTIGRANGNDIQIDDISTSGHHAHIEIKPNEYMDGVTDILITDLDSTNGTFVNEQKVQQCKLHHNDIIRIAWNQFKLIDDQSNQLDETAFMLQE